MVAITDSTKSKSGRISLKEEPIDGGIKRRENLMSSIFRKSTCSCKKSMFLCRESQKSSFDVNQESFVWRCTDLPSGMWWELQRDWLSLTQRGKKTAIIETWPCLLNSKGKKQKLWNEHDSLSPIWRVWAPLIHVNLHAHGWKQEAWPWWLLYVIFQSNGQNSSTVASAEPWLC